MSASDLQIKYFLDGLKSQTSQDSEISPESMDNQFISLAIIVEKYFIEHEYDQLFDWFIELVKKEFELKEELRKESQEDIIESINQLISKVNRFRTSIIDMLIDEINDSYRDFTYIYDSSPIFASKIKLFTLLMANSFINNLHKNRGLCKSIFDQYIFLICNSLNIYCS